MLKIVVGETIIIGRRMYDVGIEIDVAHKFPWTNRIKINGKHFEVLMKNFPANADQAAVVFETLSDEAERREFCEYIVENLMVVMPDDTRARAVDYYNL